MPVAIAPDETSTTSAPRSWAAARASTRGPIWPAFSPLMDEEPTFTTIRRACGISARCAGSLLVSRRILVDGRLVHLVGVVGADFGGGRSDPSASPSAHRPASRSRCSSARASALASMRSW